MNPSLTNINAVIKKVRININAVIKKARLPFLALAMLLVPAAVTWLMYNHLAISSAAQRPADSEPRVIDPAAPASALSGAPSAPSIAYVDARRLIDEAPQGQDELDKLEAEFAARKKELTGRFDLLQKRQADLKKNQLVMSKADLKTSTRDLIELERQVVRDQREYSDDYKLRRSQGLNNLEKIITAAVIDIAKKRKLDVVFQQVVYAHSDINLTEQVLTELKKRYKKKGK